MNRLTVFADLMSQNLLYFVNGHKINGSCVQFWSPLWSSPICVSMQNLQAAHQLIISSLRQTQCQGQLYLLTLSTNCFLVAILMRTSDQTQARHRRCVPLAKFQNHRFSRLTWPPVAYCRYRKLSTIITSARAQSKEKRDVYWKFFIPLLGSMSRRNIHVSLLEVVTVLRLFSGYTTFDSISHRFATLTVRYCFY